MPYNPTSHHRRSVRMKNYDYSQPGLYFITICCENRDHRLGKIESGDMILNDAGKMVATQWMALSTRFANIVLHENIVMPDHFHGIIQIVAGATLVVAQFDDGMDKNEEATLVVAQFDDEDQIDADIQKDLRATTRTRVAPTGAPTIGDMIAAFKSITTVEYIHGVKTIGLPRFVGKLWQRNYYESIIRNEKSLHNISEYINNNPGKWKKGKFKN